MNKASDDLVEFLSFQKSRLSKYNLSSISLLVWQSIITNPSPFRTITSLEQALQIQALLSIFPFIEYPYEDTDIIDTLQSIEHFLPLLDDLIPAIFTSKFRPKNLKKIFEFWNPKNSIKILEKVAKVSDSQISETLVFLLQNSNNYLDFSEKMFLEKIKFSEENIENLIISLFDKNLENQQIFQNSVFLINLYFSSAQNSEIRNLFSKFEAKNLNPFHQNLLTSLFSPEIEINLQKLTHFPEYFCSEDIFTDILYFQALFKSLFSENPALSLENFTQQLSVFLAAIKNDESMLELSIESIFDLSFSRNSDVFKKNLQIFRYFETVFIENHSISSFLQTFSKKSSTFLTNLFFTQLSQNQVLIKSRKSMTKFDFLMIIDTEFWGPFFPELKKWCKNELINAELFSASFSNQFFNDFYNAMVTSALKSPLSFDWAKVVLLDMICNSKPELYDCLYQDVDSARLSALKSVFASLFRQHQMNHLSLLVASLNESAEKPMRKFALSSPDFISMPLFSSILAKSSPQEIADELNSEKLSLENIDPIFKHLDFDVIVKDIAPLLSPEKKDVLLNSLVMNLLHPEQDIDKNSLLWIIDAVCSSSYFEASPSLIGNLLWLICQHYSAENVPINQLCNRILSLPDPSNAAVATSALREVYLSRKELFADSQQDPELRIYIPPQIRYVKLEFIQGKFSVFNHDIDIVKDDLSNLELISRTLKILQNYRPEFITHRWE